MNYLDVLFSFKGRINRTIFWKYNLGLLLTVLSLGILLFSMGAIQTEEQLDILSIWMILIYIWPYIAISVKRFHDRDKSGSWVLITFVWWIIDLGLLEGTPGKNMYD